MITEIPVTEEEKEALRKAAEAAKRLTAKDVIPPEPPKMELVKEDFNPIEALFGGRVKFNNHSFWTRLIFGIIFFGLGMMIGFAIGRG